MAGTHDNGPPPAKQYIQKPILTWASMNLHMKQATMDTRLESFAYQIAHHIKYSAHTKQI